MAPNWHCLSYIFLMIFVPSSSVQICIISLSFPTPAEVKAETVMLYGSKTVRFVNSIDVLQEHNITLLIVDELWDISGSEGV